MYKMISAQNRTFSADTEVRAFSASAARTATTAGSHSVPLGLGNRRRRAVSPQNGDGDGEPSHDNGSPVFARSLGEAARCPFRADVVELRPSVKRVRGHVRGGKPKLGSREAVVVLYQALVFRFTELCPSERRF